MNYVNKLIDEYLQIRKQRDNDSEKFNCKERMILYKYKPNNYTMKCTCCNVNNAENKLEIKEIPKYLIDHDNLRIKMNEKLYILLASKNTFIFDYVIHKISIDGYTCDIKGNKLSINKKYTY